MKIVFRTDASLQIGTGHVMRCLTLANALRDRGAECRFVCKQSPGNRSELIRAGGFEVLELPAQADLVSDDWKGDAEAVTALISGEKLDWLIVDHYGLDAQWESALRPHFRKLMAIDDLADRQHDCDLLLDQNLVANMDHRYAERLPDNCGTMLGPDYALLQPQYAKLHPRTPPREGPVKRILVYFGGADTNNVTGRVVAAFLSLNRNDITIDVIVGSDSPHVAAIREQIQGRKHITLHADLPSLAQLMAKADLAIGAGGATSWERCCLGLPSLVFTLAENQEALTAELDRRGLVRWLGHFDTVTEEHLSKAISDIVDNGIEASWSENCSRLVDGKGAARVSGYVVVQPGTPFVARLARQDDEALFLEWANDPFTRKNSFDSRRIDPDAHRTWFRPRLQDPENCRMYVVETDEALPIGQVRLSRSGDEWEIHYGLDARCRGRGIGASLLATALKAARAKNNIGQGVFGRVKPDNTPSRKIFTQLGFSEESAGSELIYRQASS